jgi:ribA/ribD-fused uncharacterized protein
MRITEKYILFWGSIYSQWYLASFTDPISGITFNCNEQYMMWHKAKCHDDEETADLVLLEKNQNKQKKLGRSVKNFDEAKWNKVKFEVVCNANILKFTQNPELLAQLLLSGDKHIVEASPEDKIWGIGMGENDKGVEDPKNWKGQNLLGEAIMLTRTYLRSLLNSVNLHKLKYDV